MTVPTIFRRCVEAIKNGELIHRQSSKDKEFHFQNWFKRRLEETKLNFDQGGRNSYPDFTMVKFTDGYEIKGLAYPGRDANFDSNSQAPTGFHNGRTIYYVFGRYPQKPDGKRYPVLDLVICHGDFLNADHDYVHESKSFKGFGSYGDILVRDRKMYVVPTPFHLVDGIAHHRTLILPADAFPGDKFLQVGELVRLEASEMVVAYAFNLQSNELTLHTVPNPGAGRKHVFRAWRTRDDRGDRVSIRDAETASVEADANDEEAED